MGMRYLIALVPLAIAACGASQGIPATPSDDALASQLVWVDSFKMDAAILPAIAWQPGCPMQWATTPNGVSGQLNCVAAAFDLKSIRLQKSDRISNSSYVMALKMYQLLITRPVSDQAFTVDDSKEVDTATSKLVAAGL